MDLGFFTMPIHPPGRHLAETLEEDRELVLLAEPIDAAALRRGMWTFFVQTVSDYSGYIDVVLPPPPPPPTPPPSVVDYGRDGRLTFLLLGMDARDDTVTRTPEEFAQLVRSDMVRFAKVVKDAGVTLE